MKNQIKIIWNADLELWFMYWGDMEFAAEGCLEDLVQAADKLKDANQEQEAGA